MGINLALPTPTFALAAAIVDETTFGLSKGAGTASTVPRGDHTHGSPTESTRYTFTELATTSHNAAGAGAGGSWVDMTISEAVANSHVLVTIYMSPAAGTFGVRTNGSALDRRITLFTQFTYYTTVVKCDASKVIEYYQNAAGTDYTIYVLGYWV